MRILHVCASWRGNNGAANIARMVMDEQARSGCEVSCSTWASPRALRSADEVWIHCSWLPCLWWAALLARKHVWMPEASYDPIRLAYSGWKKRLAAPIERFFLRRADRVVATCAAEAGWIRAFEPRVKRVETMDIKRFFVLNRRSKDEDRSASVSPLRILYLGRRHPLKGIQYLESAVEQINSASCTVELKILSSAFGTEKEAAFAWCNVLLLPTLSENFGLVVAEALQRGKRVITTDGAPAWNPAECGDFGGLLSYLQGYRDGTESERIELLKEAITKLTR